MTYILCTVVGAVLTTLTLILTWEYSQYDFGIMLWIGMYTLGVYTLSYGVNKLKYYVWRVKR